MKFVYKILALVLAILFFRAIPAFSQGNFITRTVERIFGPSQKTLQYRSAERAAALPDISGNGNIFVGGIAEQVWEPYDRVDAYACPSVSDDNHVEVDVRFLCDPACGGRATGTSGLSSATLYVFRRMTDCGLETYQKAFSTDGVTGHNVIGESRRAGASKWIIVMARMDSVGDHGQDHFPGADANASGVAALLSLAENSAGVASGYNLLFAVLDGHHHSMSGAYDLYRMLESRGLVRRNIAMVVNLEEIGSNLVPPVKDWRNYIIALGGDRYSDELWRCNSGLWLHLNFDYYGSKGFTEIFYKRASDHKPFLEKGVPCVMFTSGITLNTNRVTDTPETLDYELLGKRIELVRRWIDTL